MTPARKLTHTMKFEHFWMQKDTNFGNTRIFWHFGPEKRQNQPQKYTNFGNAIILCYLGPENHQIQTQKTRILGKTALIDPSKNASKIRKVFIFQEFHTLIEMNSLTSTTQTNQPFGNT